MGKKMCLMNHILNDKILTHCETNQLMSVPWMRGFAAYVYMETVFCVSGA
jgi:hypothetical protein